MFIKIINGIKFKIIFPKNQIFFPKNQKNGFFDVLAFLTRQKIVHNIVYSVSMASSSLRRVR